MARVDDRPVVAIQGVSMEPDSNETSMGPVSTLVLDARAQDQLGNTAAALSLMESAAKQAELAFGRTAMATGWVLMQLQVLYDKTGDSKGSCEVALRLKEVIVRYAVVDI